MTINNLESSQVFNKFKALPNRKTTFSTNMTDVKTNNDINEDNEKKFSFKKTSNILGVAAWLGIVALGIYKVGFLRPKSAESIASKAADKAKLIKESIKNSNKNKQTLDELLQGKSKLNKFFTKGLYKVGKWARNMEDVFGSELYNNLTYAFGTLVVMPLVIWCSPIGKKDSSTSDKAAATLRQPFSVFSTLMMQFTFDKLFDKYTPRNIEKNKFESKEVKNGTENGKIKASLFDKIRYNYGEVKRIFKEELPNLDVEKGGLKGILNKEQAAEIIENAGSDINIVKERHQLLLKGLENDKSLVGEELAEFNEHFKSFKNKKFTKEELRIIKQKLKTISNSCGLNKIAKQGPKIINNVLISSIIGCTFLNVIYGKSMKAYQNIHNKKNADNTKEVK